MAMTSQAAARRNRRNRSRTGIAQAGLYHVHPPAVGERHTHQPFQRITGRSCGVNITRGLIANLLGMRAFAGASAAPARRVLATRTELIWLSLPSPRRHTALPSAINPSSWTFAPDPPSQGKVGALGALPPHHPYRVTVSAWFSVLSPSQFRSLFQPEP